MHRVRGRAQEAERRRGRPRRAYLWLVLFALPLAAARCGPGASQTDLNADGYVDDADVALAASCVALPDPATEPHCARSDVNRDGSTNAADLAIVEQYLGRILIAPVWPAFEGSSHVLSSSGIVYALSVEDARIYRWSLVSGLPLAPIGLDADPRFLAYSDAHGQLYVAYADGRITRIDAAVPLAETPFAMLSRPPLGLEALGNLIFAADDAGFWESHYTFDPDGTLLDSRDTVHDSDEYAWNAATARMFFFRDPQSPNDLLFEPIDPVTGVIGPKQESPYHGDYVMQPPIRVSVDGTRVLLGTGNIFDADTLEVDDPLPIDLSDAVWLTDGRVLTIRPVEGSTLLEQWTPALKLEHVQRFEGTPLRILGAGDEQAVVTQVGDTPMVHGYQATLDGDGDGVPFPSDALPHDRAASLDSDGDGYPDGWNPGSQASDSTTGLVLDAFPHDSACQLAEHALPGSPSVCDIAGRVPAYTPARIVTDDHGVVYLLSPENARTFRWSLAGGHDLNPILVPSRPGHMAFSEANQRLHFADSMGAISLVDLSDPSLRQTGFAALPSAALGLQAAGPFLFAMDPSGVRNSHYTFAEDGTLISARDFNRASAEVAWSPANDRVYYFRDGVTPNDLHHAYIDPVTGALGARMDSPYHSQFTIEPPIRVSTDGSQVLLGSGDIYDGLTLEVIGALPTPITDALWLDDGSLLTLRDPGDGSTLLEQRGPDLRLEHTAVFEGSPLRVVESQALIGVVALQAGEPTIRTYTINPDGDADGVPNALDRFLLDPAASLDSDGDGFPDAWNPGYGPADSTTGLVLDAFPFDAACQVPEHGLPQDPGVCDIVHGIPDYLPSHVLVDAQGVIHLLSPEHRRIFRWSFVEDYHVKAAGVDADPLHFAYSGDNNRLYLAYASGSITQMDPVQPEPIEVPFAATPDAPIGLQTAGPYLFAIDASGSWETYYTFAADGSPVAAEDWNSGAAIMAWSSATEHMYLLRESGSPSVLMTMPIDAASGTLGERMNSPNNGDFAVAGPIRVAPDGSRLVLGSGDLYDPGSLELVASLGISPADALWLDDGTLLTLRDAGDGITRLEQWDPDLQLVNVDDFAGSPIRVVDHQGSVVVVTHHRGQPAFGRYVPNTDVDGDGVPTLDDAFPTDPSASLDSDGDGAPDTWNPGRSAADSTSGLVLDAFPFDSACQLAAHAMPGDPLTCDVETNVPDYTPAAVVTDAAGIVHLLGSDSGRIFRWSTSTGHLNPIAVAPRPTHMAYSSGNDRIYVAYDSGAITQLNPALSLPSESRYTTLPEPTFGLQPAGADLFTIVGSYPSHFTLAANGAWISQLSNRQPSSALAWSPEQQRIYLFRDATIPNALTWASIDPATGDLGAYGSSPYHGHPVQAPIRPSANGRVLLGTGDIFDAVSLEIVDSLPIAVADARWLDDGSLLTIRDAGDGSTLLEQWSPTLRLDNQRSYPGTPLALAGLASSVVVVTQEAAQPRFATYLPTLDGDADGVPSPTDAFPQDPAASLDTDRDGHPDAWNPGFSAGDSTTGLQIDAFPLDSACHLVEHATPGAPATCDIAARIPSYEPGRSVVDAAGTVYTLSTGDDRLYRWSLPDAMPLNPVVVGPGPRHLAYSGENDRLYVGYDSGEVTQLVPGSGILTEEAFAVVAQEVLGLQTAGARVFVVHNAYSYTAHSTFEADGTPISTVDGRYRSADLTWSAANERMYFFRGASTPDDIHWVEIDAADGSLGATADSPYYNQFAIAPPARLAPDGSRALVGSGDIFDGLTLEHIASLPTPITDGLWLDHGSLTIRSDGAGSAWIEQWSPDLDLYETTSYPGDPLRLLAWQDGVYVVVLVGGRPTFWEHVPTDDGDGDGVHNDVDAFPADPAASVDSDGDGYPDDWNAGQGPGDSTTGLLLDAFPEEPTCQLPEHGIAGVCDFVGILPPSLDDPFCELDNRTPTTPSGWLDLGTAGEFIALCNGWLLIADTERNGIAVRNVVNGIEGAFFALSASPDQLALDEARKFLYVSLPDQDEIVRLDLILGSVVPIPVTAPRDLALGAGGGLLITTKQWQPTLLFWVEPGATVPIGGWDVAGLQMQYNAVADELILVSDTSPARLSRYAFDPATGPTLLQTLSNVGSNQRNLALSQDAASLALAAGGGNGTGYTIHDFVATDLTQVRGEWDTGSYPTAIAFDRADATVLASDGDALLLFDRRAHTLLQTHALPTCSYDRLEQIALSRGGILGLARQVCDLGGEFSRFHWFHAD